MSNLVDMMLPKKTEKDLKAEAKSCCSVSCDQQDRWPYGLQLRFETDEVNKLPFLKTVKVGDKVIIIAEAVITETRQSETQSTQRDKEIRHTVEIQCQKVSVEAKVKKKPEDMSPKEYKSFREENN